MKLTTTMTVRRRTRTKYSGRNPEGSGYCEYQMHLQDLVKTVKLGKLTIWKEIMDTEEIPSHVVFSIGAMGFDSSGWKSKFSEYIPTR